MKHLIIIALLSTIIGCSVDNQSQNDYTKSQHDASTNLTLLPSTEMWIDFNTIVALHKNMQACLGLSINPETDETVIQFVSFEEKFAGTKNYVWGIHSGSQSGVSYVYVNTDLDKAPYIYQGFDRDTYTDTQTIKHEFIHSISYHVNDNGNNGHGEAFTRCDAWVNTYN